MKKLLLPLLLLLALPALAARIEITGPFEVIDGDTIHFGGEAVRLLCIDAPESDQPFGDKSTAYLQQLTAGKNVTCIGHFRDKYKRLLGFCYAGGKPSLNYEMVKAGLAIAYGGKACSTFHEAAAKAPPLGLWADASFITPHEWRKAHPKYFPEDKKN